MMINRFEMTQMGLMSYFLRIEIQVHKGIFIFQKIYASVLLKKIKMEKLMQSYSNFD